jgi:hypothetical protein
MSAGIASWIDGYRRAWESNDPADITALFTGDAVYHPSPAGETWVGLDAIVAGWLESRDEPGDTTFTWVPLVDTPELGIAQCVSDYGATSGAVYDNLWVIRFAPDGRATEFTDWWVARD